MNSELKASFEEYFQTYYQQAFKYAFKKVSDISIAEDITMDAFVACFNKFDSFDPQKASFATWLYVVLNNKIKNYYRGQKNEESIEDIGDIISAQEDEMIQSIHLSEMRTALALAIESLSNTQKQIVISKYFRDMSSDEIAADVGCTPGNVRVQLTRALKKIKNFFEEHNYKWEM